MSADDKSRSEGFECTNINFEMTDKNFETADFTSSEKQARLRTVFSLLFIFGYLHRHNISTVASNSGPLLHDDYPHAAELTEAAQREA